MSNEILILRPFGPTVAKVTMPSNLVNTLNKYVDEIISNEEKSKELNYGYQLAGNVKQEFKLEKEFVESSGWGKFLANNSSVWINKSTKPPKKITKFNLISTWIVRQFENDYNPLHTHNGHISGVGYLKVPSSFGEYSQKDKSANKNGSLQLVHGSKSFICESTFNVTPKVGDFYFFPNYMMHTVYPFTNTNEERRSISFNAFVDENIYNVYT